MITPSSWILTNLEDVVDIRDDLRQPINAEEHANRVGPFRITVQQAKSIGLMDS